MIDPFVPVIVFAAIGVQSTVGFGLGLIAMPLLSERLDPVHAAMLVALIALTAEPIILLRYRGALRWRAIMRLLVGSLVGIPLGVLIISRIDSAILLAILGVVVVGYALYGLLNLRLPTLRSEWWGIGFGLTSGVLSGAFNTGGPPYIIFGTCRRWQPDEFKANLQTLFLVSSVVVTTAHIAAGHLTGDVLRGYAVSLPALLIAAIVGFWLSRRINAAAFRRIVLVLLLIIGVRLLLSL